MATDYEKALQKQRTAAGLQGAATGASAGSAIGSAFGPAGTLIGAGIGALGGGLIGGLTYQDDPLQVAQLKELEDLRRRQELGALGLTDAERAQLEAELIDPMRTARREQQLQFQQALSGQDIGAGSFFRYAQGEDQRRAAQEQEARVKIEAQDIAERKREEDRIMQLLGEESKRQEEARASNLAAIQTGLVGTAQAYGEAATIQAEEDAIAEQERELLEYYNNATTPEERQAAMELQMYQQYLYGGR